MNLTPEVLEVLKNFQSFNRGLVIKKGELQRTISEDEYIIAEAKTAAFPDTFAIYDLGKLLTILSSMKEPVLDSVDNVRSLIVLRDENSVVQYRTSLPSLVLAPPDKMKIKLTPDALSFDLPAQSLTKLLKMASVIGLTSVIFRGGDGKVVATATNQSAGIESNQVKMEIVSDYTGGPFEAHVKAGRFDVLQDDYRVEVEPKSFMKLTGVNKDVVYYIVLEN